MHTTINSTDKMKHELVEHLTNQTTDLGEEAVYLPPDIFLDPVRFEAEKQKIFREMPIFAALSADIPQAGDMTLFDALGPSILLVRGKSGKVNAFLNMCVHRGTRLVSDCTPRKRLTCPFHGWTYDLEGKLIGVPRREAFDSEDLDSRNLIRMPVGEWAGMIFVKGAPGDERIDVEEYLGGMAPRIRDMGLEKLKLVDRTRIDYKCNWKYAVDTSNELYHIGPLHLKSFGAQFVGDSAVTELYGLHLVQLLAQKHHNRDEAEYEVRGIPIDFAMVHFIFPNLTLTIREFHGGQRYVNFLIQFPGDSVGEAFLLESFYKSGDVITDEDRAGFTANLVTIREDISVSESVHLNLLHAPSNYFSVFGRNEFAAPAVHENIARIIGLPIPEATKKRPVAVN